MQNGQYAVERIPKICSMRANLRLATNVLLYAMRAKAKSQCGYIAIYCESSTRSSRDARCW